MAERGPRNTVDVYTILKRQLDDNLTNASVAVDAPRWLRFVSTIDPQIYLYIGLLATEEAMEEELPEDFSIPFNRI